MAKLTYDSAFEQTWKCHKALPTCSGLSVALGHTDV